MLPQTTPMEIRLTPTVELAATSVPGGVQVSPTEVNTEVELGLQVLQELHLQPDIQ
jgi:hypothetical protein